MGEHIMAFDRISARRGHQVNLDTRFFQGGILSDPFALYRIEIFQGSVSPENIIDAVDIVAPEESSYPSPIEQIITTDIANGVFRYAYDIPSDATAPQVYLDVWYFYGSDPRTISLPNLSSHEDKLISVTNKFWVYPDKWYADGGLNTIRLAFEPLDIKFRKPEVRPLQLGIMPLPLYDYNFNYVACLLPYLEPTITISTENCEIIVKDAKCEIKLRMGSYRSNPFVVSYLLNTSSLLSGTYKYRITIPLPDGTTRVSDDFYLTIS